ncbi:hypothetical protein [Nocardia rhizosphaerae]|uniref:hypothetical protein n=1 Tax=Nocardia rhizosphaerae TaxID=1691571 RepID=UPI003671CC6C
MTIAVLVGFVGTLLLIRALGRWNVAPAPVPVLRTVTARPTVQARQHAMMDR